MIVGVNGFLRAHLPPGQLDCTIRDDLVDVHIGLRSGAGLPDSQRKMRIEFSFDDVIGCANDQPRFLGIEFPEVAIDQCGGLLEDAHRFDDLRGHYVARPLAVPDIEVYERTCGLSAVIFL